MDLFDVTVLAEAPEPAPEMDPFDVTVLAEAPVDRRAPGGVYRGPRARVGHRRNAEQPSVSEQPARRTPPSEIDLNLFGGGVG